MKSVIALLIVGVAVVSAVDWKNVKPLHLDDKLPFFKLQSQPEGRITKGDIAHRNQFPYQVGLLLYVKGGAAWCGGSVLSNRWIVTAAHCTDTLTVGVDVYVGAWDRSDKKEKGQQIIFVQTKNVIVHEDWDPEALKNDISLIKLPVAIQFNQHIKPVNLPKKSDDYSLYNGERGIASGWGLTGDNETAVTDKLRWIDVPIMSNSGCSPWFLGVINPSNICIKTSGGTSICSGDSGGPLVVNEDGESTLVGVTSFGISLGCERGWPGVFTRVTSFLDWIEENTKLQL